jgi:hypothetical protein
VKGLIKNIPRYVVTSSNEFKLNIADYTDMIGFGSVLARRTCSSSSIGGAVTPLTFSYAVNAYSPFPGLIAIALHNFDLFNACKPDSLVCSRG